MAASPVDYETELRRQFAKGGPVSLKATTPGDRLLADLVSELVRDYSKRSGKASDCDSLYLEDFFLDGNLDLNNRGLEGAPLISLELLNCNLAGDILMEYGYLKSLNIHGSRPVELFSIKARGVTIIDRLKLGALQLAPSGEIDISESRLKGGVEIKGLWAAAALNSSPTRTGVRQLKLASAVVGGHLTLEGVKIFASDDRALDGEELEVHGTLRIGALVEKDGCPPERSVFRGEVNLRGAKVDGQLLFEGVEMTALHPHREPMAGGAATKLLRPSFALNSEGAVVGGDIHFREHDDNPAHPCVITGQVDISGVTVRGEVHVYGFFDATSHRIRAIRAGRIQVGGDLRFGYAPWQDQYGLRRCEIKGECDFSGSKIGGKAIFSGSCHRTTRNYLPSDGHRREQKQAIHFKGAVIGTELWFESGAIYRCHVEGLTLTGATIGGRFLIYGCTINTAGDRCTRQQFLAWRHAPRKASQNLMLGIKTRRIESTPLKSISANGAVIRGGLIFSVSQHQGKKVLNKTVLRGGFRLRNAVVDGPVKIEGVSMVADKSGIALWASNTRFGSDVNIQPAEQSRYSHSRSAEILGELRFQGAQVHGRLWLQGIYLEAGRTGVALDCYTATVQLSLVLGSFCPKRAHRSGVTARCTVIGLVSIVHLHTQSLTIGANPVAAIDDAEDALYFTGAILMRDMRLQSTVFIANALLQPTESLEEGDLLREVMQMQLERWGVYRPFCIVYANYAKLGTRLFVRLLRASRGLISLYGASTGTIGGYSGYYRATTVSKEASADSNLDALQSAAFLEQRKAKHRDPERDEKLRENWGELLLGKVQARSRGEARPSFLAARMVLLNIDEFNYDRTNDSRERTPEYEKDRWWLFFMVAGRPSPRQLGPRYQWLRRVVENPGAREMRGKSVTTPPELSRKSREKVEKRDVVVSAHRQLARVYREMGRLQDSYYYTRERRWLQIRYGSLNKPQRVLDVLYSTFFGFGYSPTRALYSLLILYTLSVGLLLIALDLRPAPHTTVGARSGYVSTTSSRQGCHNSLCAPAGLLWEDDGRSFRGLISLSLFSEAGKLILPGARIGKGTSLTLDPNACLPLRLAWDSIIVLSWLIFPLSIATITGVLRENP